MSEIDLRAVDEVCRLAVALRQLGCRLHLVAVDPELGRLLELAGVRDVLGDCPVTRPTVGHRSDDLA